MAAFFHGLILALGLILPLGPQNTYIFTQGLLVPRWIHALPAVCTAFLSDGLLIALGVGGASLAFDRFPIAKTVLFLFGAVFLFAIGGATWRSAGERVEIEKARPARAREQVLFTLSVSLLNPHAVLDTIGVIGPAALTHTGAARLAFTAGAMTSSLLWFFALALFGRTIRRLKAEWVRHVARLSAVFIWGAAAYLLYAFVRSLTAS